MVVLLLVATSSHAQFRGKITVTRVLLDARVTDSHGDPICDLGPEHFVVKIGGEPVVVESAEWVDDLALGLAQLAADTGGTYQSTFRFPQSVIQRLERTVSGHYELALLRPEGLPSGSHAIDIRVTRPRAQVLVQRMYVDR